MGQYRITIQGVGNHGCGRRSPTSAKIERCQQPGCVDCAAEAFVATLKGAGSSIEHATLEHWPATSEQVSDDLLTGVRVQGQFADATPPQPSAP